MRRYAWSREDGSHGAAGEGRDGTGHALLVEVEGGGRAGEGRTRMGSAPLTGLDGDWEPRVFSGQKGRRLLKKKIFVKGFASVISGVLGKEDLLCI